MCCIMCCFVSSVGLLLPLPLLGYDSTAVNNEEDSVMIFPSNSKCHHMNEELFGVQRGTGGGCTLNSGQVFIPVVLSFS